MVELFPDFCTFNQIVTFRKIGNSSTISLTVELFPIYAFELFPIYAFELFPIYVIRTIPAEALFFFQFVPDNG